MVFSVRPSQSGVAHGVGDGVGLLLIDASGGQRAAQGREILTRTWGGVKKSRGGVVNSQLLPVAGGRGTGVPGVELPRLQSGIVTA